MTKTEQIKAMQEEIRLIETKKQLEHLKRKGGAAGDLWQGIITCFGTFSFFMTLAFLISAIFTA